MEGSVTSADKKRVGRVHICGRLIQYQGSETLALIGVPVCAEIKHTRKLVAGTKVDGGIELGPGMESAQVGHVGIH